MNLIQFCPDDSGRLLHFYQTLDQSVREVYQPFKRLSISTIREHLDGAARGAALSCGIELDGRIIAHAFITAIGQKHPVLGIGVHSSYQKRGVGTQLLEALLRRAESDGITRITLTVMKKNVPALRLYEKHGFRIMTEYTFRNRNDSYFMERLTVIKTYKIVVFVPEDDMERVKNAMFESGGGHIGNYDRCAYYALGRGQFRGGRGTHPAIGSPGVVETVPEYRLEMICSQTALRAVVKACLAAHPYEEPAIDVLSILSAEECLASNEQT